MNRQSFVLVVDDQSQNLELLEAYLVPQGYKIIKAKTGEEALAQLSDHPIDLILLDVMMPGMDGFEVTRRVRQDQAHRLLPIILVTALRETEDRVKGIEAGCDDFISKPVDKPELLARVRSLLKVKAYNDLMSHYQKDLESEVAKRTEELNQALENLRQDISQRERVEEALRQAEAKYRSIFENAQEGIFRSTPEGRIITANQALANIFGYASPEELMTGITDVARQHYVNPEDRIEIEKAIEEHGFVKGYEARNYKKDGSIIWISMTRQAIRDERGQIVHYDGLTEDITNRKQAAERIKMALNATVQAIAVIVETRDPYTAGHQRRVADLAHAIAVEMNLPFDRIEGIRMAAAIHDIGKISVPAEILSKPSKLSNIEFMLIQTHSQSGFDILKNIDFPWPIARIVLEHHERMNGSGYPNGLTRDQILMESRILSVADVVESIASHRPYRVSLGIDKALAEISKNKEILYDPEVSDACLRLFQEKDYEIID